MLAPAKRPADPRAPENSDCQTVAQALVPAALPDANPRLVWYDRYILGQRALAQLLLSHFSVQTAASIVKAAAFSAFGLVLILAWRKEAFAICVIAALFLLFYGLGQFGGKLYFAPLDVTHAMVLLVALYRPFGTAPLGSLVVVGATLIAVFEVLTGGIPIALVLVALLTGLSAPDQRSFWQRVLILMIAFAVAAVGCFVLKLAIVSVYGGTNAFAEHFDALLYRLRGDFSREADPSMFERLSHYATDIRIIAVLYLIAVYAYWSLLIGWGSPIFGMILVMAGVSSLVIGTMLFFKQRRDSSERFPPALSGCWLAFRIAIAWVVLFWQHSLTHAFFRQGC